MKARTQRLALVVAACVLGALPAACASGASSLPNAGDAGTRTISSGGSANTGGGGGGSTVPPPSTGGGGGGGKAPLPGAMAFTSGCGAIDSVSSSAATNLGLPGVTITTKVAEHNCINIYFKVDFVNASTGQLEDSEACFNFTTTPYTCNIKDKTAQPGTAYQTIVTVWDAAKSPLGAPVDPAAVLATESLTVTTVGAPPNQGA